MSDNDTTSVESETAVAESDAVRDAIVDNLRIDIGDGVVDAIVHPGVDVWVRVSAEAWADAAAALKNRGFDFFDFLSAIDWLPSPFGNSEDDPFAAEEQAGDDDADDGLAEMRHGYTGGESRFQVLARFSNLQDHVAVTIKADVPDNLEVPTILGSFAGANWHEREAHEMYGITFAGHPDLRNLYLPSEFEGHPLRKDFPLLARHIKPWPGIADVEPMAGSAGGDDE